MLDCTWLKLRSYKPRRLLCYPAGSWLTARSHLSQSHIYNHEYNQCENDPMGRPALNLAGREFGLLTVMYEDGRNERGAVTWYCECRCGGNKTVTSAASSRRLYHILWMRVEDSGRK